MKLFNTAKGIALQDQAEVYHLKEEWDMLLNTPHLHKHLKTLVQTSPKLDNTLFNDWVNTGLRPPIGTQEVWAAGVTYLRSRDARMEESKSSGGGDFYDKVYAAERPELFFKANPGRVAAHNEEVFIRHDSEWNVPEPELTLFINSQGAVQGYTIGNDMSSRSIEGANPLYLPQAKVYERSAALGPSLLVPDHPLPPETRISIVIDRAGNPVFEDSIAISRMKRSFDELARFLFRECAFKTGCFLMTGTGIVPPGDFTLEPGDQVQISIEGIGTLQNKVALSPLR